ncbi:MAG: ROK family protein [Candidatus Dormibacteria bacterium]
MQALGRTLATVYGLIDIGGTKLLCGVAAAEPPPRNLVRLATPEDGALATLTAMLEEAAGGAALEGIGIAVPGPFDRAAGALLAPPNLPAAWHDLPLRAALGERFGCPVVLENDANCAALGEARFGAGRGLNSLVYYTVSTGIGCGVVHDGRLLTGRNDTEGGHQVLWPAWAGGPPCACGGAGCLEALASGTAIRSRFGVAAEELDDPDAWADVGRWLGLAVVNATALHDPEAVVFGGGVCGSWDRFWPALEATVSTSLRLQPAPRISRAQLGDDRNLWGAIALLARTAAAAGRR